MEMSFDPLENPWSYRAFWLAGLAWFVAPAWIVPLVAMLENLQWSAVLSQVDRWVVVPQVRFLLFVCPPFAERWPGPFGSTLMIAHRQMFSLVYAMLGWISIRLVCAQYQDKATRIWWLFIYWVVCVGFMDTVALLMIYFGALPVS